jgi:hypothetical protein
LRKLYLNGTGDTWWLLKDQLYGGLTSKVKWRDKVSTSFPILQGVRQGGIPSANDYKVYINDVLDILETSELGLYIGDVYCGVPSCADDLIMLATTALTLACMLLIACFYACRERYVIHPTKSQIAIFNNTISTEAWNEAKLWSINEEPAPVTRQYTHLGIVRNIKDRPSCISANVTNNINCARRTLYSLMGAGLHGLNGIVPTISYKIYDTYVISRLLSGLEATLVSKKDVEELEKFHRKNLRCLQHLPERTANVAIYLLLGAWPIEAQLDMRYLSLFGSIARRFGSKIQRLAQRQCIMKDASAYSWFSRITSLLYKYSLPPPLDILNLAPNKEPWKKIVTQAVKTYWNNILVSEVSEKQSLKHLNPLQCAIGKPHQTWENTEYSPRDVRRSTIKIKLLTGTYMLQGNKATWSTNTCQKVDGCCQICHSALEDRKHFLLKCPGLTQCRDSFLIQISDCLIQNNINIQHNLDPEDALLQLILDCTHPNLYESICPESDVCYMIDRICQRMCYAMHHRRALILNYRP